MNHPSMTSRGRLIAFLVGVTIAFMLPKRVECGYPAASSTCGRIADKQHCIAYEIEPWGFYLLEHLAKTNVGFVYKSGEECR